MVHRVAAAVLLITAALLTGCGAGKSAPEATGSRLEFTVDTVDGQPFDGTSLTGKAAVLWFWAPWCPTCQQDAPLVARVAAAHPEVAFVGVGAQDQLPALQRFVTQYEVDKFPELADVHATVWAKFGVTRQPAYAFLHPDGTVDVVKGSLPEDKLTERVDALAGS